MAKINDFMIGTDYEYFVINEEGDVASAVGFIGGTKKEPLDLGEGCFRQSDNILAEANNPPVTSLDQWLYYFDYTHKKMSEILNPYGLELYVSTSEQIEKKYLRSRIARTFGCEASYCAYPNKPFANLNPSGTLRTAGLHIHVGFKPEDLESVKDIERFMRIMDVNLGAPSVLIDPDNIRRTMYGMAGEYRFTQRGEFMVIEYRSLGSYFLGSKELLAFTYNQTLKSIEDFNNGHNGYMELQEAINDYDEEACIKYMGEENYKAVQQLIKTKVNV